MLDNKFIKKVNPSFYKVQKNYFFQTKKEPFIQKQPISFPGHPKNGHIFEMAVAYTLPYHIRCISVMSILFLVIFSRGFVILNHFFSLATVCGGYNEIDRLARFPNGEIYNSYCVTDQRLFVYSQSRVTSTQCKDTHGVYFVQIYKLSGRISVFS